MSRPDGTAPKKPANEAKLSLFLWSEMLLITTVLIGQAFLFCTLFSGRRRWYLGIKSVYRFYLTLTWPPYSALGSVRLSITHLWIITMDTGLFKSIDFNFCSTPSLFSFFFKLDLYIIFFYTNMSGVFVWWTGGDCVCTASIVVYCSWTCWASGSRKVSVQSRYTTHFLVVVFYCPAISVHQVVSTTKNLVL